jgi:NAD-dependent dihydropyrimidine dehydrogenase PreA subunit
MAYVIDKEACIACGACEGVCPVEARLCKLKYGK